MHNANKVWLDRLRAAGSVQNDALVDLRGILLSGLRKTFLGRTGVDESLLEDVTQEALIKTLNNLDQFQGRSHFPTWTMTIAVRVAMTELRRRHWKDVSLDHVLGNESHGAHADSEPQLETGAMRLVAEMYHIIDIELTEKQRTALLAELKGMPLEEIGRRMGSNRNAIYKLTHDARKRIRQCLEAAGYSIADLQTA